MQWGLQGVSPPTTPSIVLGSVGHGGHVVGLGGKFSLLPATGSFIHVHGFGYLTCVVYAFWKEPSKHMNHLSYDAALILIVMVLLLIGARLTVVRTQRYAESRGR